MKPYQLIIEHCSMQHPTRHESIRVLLIDHHRRLPILDSTSMGIYRSEIEQMVLRMYGSENVCVTHLADSGGMPGESPDDGGH